MWICFDLASQPSSGKYKRLHLQCYFRVDFCNVYRDSDFASCIRYIGFCILDICSRLRHGFVCDHDMRVLSGNPKKKLNCRVPAIDGAHNRQDQQQQNAKLSRTLFIVITASLVFWIPGIVVSCTYHLCLKCIPLLVVHIFNFFHLANSVVNPIIYRLRIPMFRETFKRMKLCKQLRKYTVNYTP